MSHLHVLLVAPHAASLVKALEEGGIGRPSTYASIMKLLVDRGYVIREGRALVPQPLGRLLTAFLHQYFARYVDYNFTSQLEEQLDDVSGGDRWCQHAHALHHHTCMGGCREAACEWRANIMEEFILETKLNNRSLCFLVVSVLLH